MPSSRRRAGNGRRGLVLAASLLVAGCGGSHRAPSAGGAAVPDSAGGARPSTDLSLTLPKAGAPGSINAGGQVFMVDAQGRALITHGWNAGEPTVTPLAKVDAAMLDGMRATGANLLRLQVAWADLEPTRGHPDPAQEARIAAVLDLAAARGLWVVLVMHQDGFGPVFGHHGMPAWATRTDGLPFLPTGRLADDLKQPGLQRAWQHLYEDPDLRQAQADAWLRLVRRFHAHAGLLGYDLLDDPWGEAHPNEIPTLTAARIESTQLGDMDQRLLDAIRTVDRQHWVFVQPLYTVGNELQVPSQLRALRDSAGRVAFAPHLYDPAMEAGGDYDPAGQLVTLALGNLVAYASAHDEPLLVTRWGPQNPTSANARVFARDMIVALSAQTSGWASSSWCTGLAFGCQLGADGRPGPSMAATVGPVLQRVAGIPTDVRSEPDRAHLQVDVSTNDVSGRAVTVIGVPTAAAPKGWTLTVDGVADPAHVRWDAARQLVLVGLPATGRHAIDVAPAP